MPAFDGAANVLATQVAAGDLIELFAGEAPAALEQSTVIAPLGSAPQGRGLITFQFGWSAAVVAVTKIFGSNIAPTSAGPDPNGIALYTSTNLQGDSYTDNLAFAFYWAQVISITPGPLLTLSANLA